MASSQWGHMVSKEGVLLSFYLLNRPGNLSLTSRRSKPGASPLAVWTANVVIGLHQGGYGRILSEAIMTGVRVRHSGILDLWSGTEP